MCLFTSALRASVNKSHIPSLPQNNLYRLVKDGVITEAEYLRILAGILSHPVDLEIRKLLSSLKIFDSLTKCKVNSKVFRLSLIYMPVKISLNSENVQSRSLQFYAPVLVK